jgi:hypothetical protein
MIFPECIPVPRNLVLSLNDLANLLLEAITGRGEHRVDLVLLLAGAGPEKLDLELLEAGRAVHLELDLPEHVLSRVLQALRSSCSHSLTKSLDTTRSSTRLSLDFSLSGSPPLMTLGSEVDPNSCCSSAAGRLGPNTKSSK